MKTASRTMVLSEAMVAVGEVGVRLWRQDAIAADAGKPHENLGGQQVERE